MDYQKKKMLTQSVGFMQAHLTLTSDLLGTLKSAGVLTAEEISTIQKDETISGKIVEFVCLLKRKDNRTYSRFLEVLEREECHSLLSILKHKSSPSEALIPDPRTMHFLEKSLMGTHVRDKVIDEMAVGLVLREIYQDEVSTLQEKLTTLQQRLRSKARTQIDLRESIESLTRPGSALGKVRPGSAMSRQATMDVQSNKSVSPPVWDVPSKLEELQGILKQKDEIIKYKEDEYNKMRALLEDNQNHLDNVLDINNQYLLIISQFNAMQLNSNNPSIREKEREIADLEHQLDESQSKLEGLKTEFGDVCDELKGKQAECDKLVKRQKKYKEMLGLSLEANEQQVEEQIQRLLDEGSMQKHEIDKIKRELEKTQTAKDNLEEKIGTLNRDKEKISFHMRQQELTMKKMKRMKQASHTIQAAENIMSQYGDDIRLSVQMKLPAIGRPGSQLGLAQLAQKNANRTGRQFCIFCRQEYFPLKSPHCRIHYRAMRDNMWTCCRDSCHRSAGCLQVPHFYMEITVDKKIFLTDGGRYMEIS